MIRLPSISGPNVTASLRLRAIQQSGGQTQQRRHLRWVPVAYRGAAAKGEAPPRGAGARSIDRKTSRHGGKHSRLPIRHHRRQPSPPFSSKAPPRPPTEKQIEYERRLPVLGHELRRLSEEYRNMLFVEPPNHVRSEPAVTSSFQDETEEIKAALRTMALDVKELCHELHRSSRLVEWPQIEQSEDLFRGLCHILQDIVRKSLRLLVADTAIATREESLALAEVGILTLAKFVSERTVFVELSKPPTPDASEKTSSWWKAPAPLKACIDLLLEPSSSVSDQPNPTENRAMAHDDPELGVPPASFQKVLHAIVSEFKEQVVSQVSSDVSLSNERAGSATSVTVDRKEIESTGRRIAALLEVMPPALSSDLDTMKNILNILCRTGTLSGARLCLDIYKRLSVVQNPHGFMIVLQAYLEATKHDPDVANRLTAAREAPEILHREWKDIVSTHRLERIALCSVVLNGLCVASKTEDEGKDRIPELNNLASSLIVRCIGRSAYTKLLEEIKSQSTTIDRPVLPIVICAAHLYALSDDTDQVLLARQILSYLMMSDYQDLGQLVSYPLVHTFNAILFSWVAEFEGNPNTKNDTGAGVAAISHATDMLDYMLSCRDCGCWPNQWTFDLMFRLLVATCPPDVGRRAEDVLSKLEMRKYYKHKSESVESVDLSVSTYHTVLSCWMEAAKDPNVLDAAECAWKLVEKLEVQSIPFLLLDRELRYPSVLSTLYNTRLRPTRQTYKLVQQICLESSHPSKAMEVAVQVHRRLLARRIVADGSDRKTLVKLLDRLEPDDEHRSSLERQVQVLLTGSNSSSAVAVNSTL